MRTLLVGWLLFASSTAMAQKDQTFFSATVDGGKKLRVSDIEAEIKVNGAFAESVLDIAFHNAAAANLQGQFNIQLPQGALVRDFALRIGEKWHYGSLTEKHKARETFEEIVRGGADPAVLAWKDGAEYSVRIFPFPAQGKRWVRIHYWQDLTQVRGKLVYHLPLPKVKADRFRLKFTAQADSLSAMQVAGAFEKHVYMKSGEDKTSFGCMIDERNFEVPGEFRVSFNQNARAPVWTAIASPKGDGNYVAVRFLTPLEDQPRALPKRILVFADTSRSTKADNKAELQQFVQKLKEKSQAEVALYEFDAQVRRVKQLGGSTYDGGTNFAAVFEEIRIQQKNGHAEAVLITDAVPTMQTEAELVNSELGGARIYFVPPHTRFNPHFAARIAEKTGGAVLASLAEFESVWRGFSTERWRYKTIALEDGSGTEVFPEQGSAVDPDEGAYLYFRAKNGKIPSAVRAVLASGSKTVELTAGDLRAAKKVPQTEYLWAMKKLISLAGQGDEYEKDLAAHATRYKLVSPKTSYIVLENDWDYQRFNITKREEAPEAEAAADMAATAPAEFAGAIGESRAAPAAPGGAPVAQRQAEVRPMKAERKAFAGGVDKDVHRGSVMRRAMDPALMAKRVVRPRFQTGSQLKLSDATHRFTKAYWSLKQVDEAYLKADEETQMDPWFYVEMAQALASRGEKARARRVLSNLFEISNEDGRALRTLGLLGCGDHCEWAMKALELAINLRPEEPQNYRDLAWLQAEGGRLNDAKTTLLRLKGKKFHDRFPGMDQLLARELAFIESLLTPGGDKGVPPVYTWITWNNDNSDADFHIEEDKEVTVSYRNRAGKGMLTNDFTRGYGPEVYSSGRAISPRYLVNYYRADPSAANGGLVVKFARIERAGDGKVKIKSRVFPLYQEGDFVTVEN